MNLPPRRSYVAPAHNIIQLAELIPNLLCPSLGKQSHGSFYHGKGSRAVSCLEDSLRLVHANNKNRMQNGGSDEESNGRTYHHFNFFI